MSWLERVARDSYRTYRVDEVVYDTDNKCLAVVTDTQADVHAGPAGHDRYRIIGLRGNNLESEVGLGGVTHERGSEFSQRWVLGTDLLPTKQAPSNIGPDAQAYVTKDATADDHPHADQWALGRAVTVLKQADDNGDVLVRLVDRNHHLPELRFIALSNLVVIAHEEHPLPILAERLHRSLHDGTATLNEMRELAASVYTEAVLTVRAAHAEQADTQLESALAVPRGVCSACMQNVVFGDGGWKHEMNDESVEADHAPPAIIPMQGAGDMEDPT